MKDIVKSPIRTDDNDMVLSLPMTVHIELTSSCCFTCRHCYNFWRKEKINHVFMTEEGLDKILDELIKNGVMHVIFTGGEPFMNRKVLLRGIKRLKSAGLSSTCNSTLAVFNSIEELKELKEAGLEHILTSLNSCSEETNDYLVTKRGAQSKIIKGMQNAISAGIRISANMIISESNINDIYRTGELASKLGAKKFFGTRVVPHLSGKIEDQKEFLIYQKEARVILDELIKVQNDFAIQVGTLVPFPYCFVFKEEDRQKYARFYSHGCPAGNKMISINANGEAHACVHEKQGYGNILEIGLRSAWKNMEKWRSGEYFPSVCKECELFDECNGGCRLATLAYKGDISSTDNLRVGWAKGKKRVEDSGERMILKARYAVPQTLRFRKENGFSVVDRFGSEVLCVKDRIAKVLMDHKLKKTAFIPEEEGILDIETLKTLINEKLLVKA